MDGFKYVNDTFGHEVGDLLLIEEAKRLSNVVEGKGIVSRWGGDEFTVIYRNIERSDLTVIIERFQDKITEPMIIADNPFFITASIGVSIFFEDGDTIEEIIKKADMTMYHNKNLSKS